MQFKIAPKSLYGWYPAFREALRVLIPYEFRRRAVALSRGRIGLWHLAARIVPRRHCHTHLQRISAKEGFLDSLTLRPQLDESEAAAMVARPVTAPNPSRPDI